MCVVKFNMQRIIIIVLALLISHTGCVHCQTMDQIPIDKEISLELTGKPIKEVVEDIRKQTGYTIIFDDKWKDLLISGHYAGVTVGEFFQRSLRKQNTALFYDDKENVVTIRFFDKNGKDDIKIVNANSSVSVPAQESEETGLYADMQSSDIKELNKKQQAAIELTRNDPNAFDPVSGMTNGEIKALNEKQNAYMQQLRKK